jgi:hypothetical protein
LVEKVPSFKHYLRKSLHGLGSDAIEKRALEEQFRMLLLNPLADLLPVEPVNLTRVIIIDALDECERPEHLSRVLSLLCQLRTVKAVRLRVLITSRSAHEIAEAFEHPKEISAVRGLDLHREFSEDTKIDITRFLKMRFADIKKKSKIT